MIQCVCRELQVAGLLWYGVFFRIFLLNFPCFCDFLVFLDFFVFWFFKAFFKKNIFFIFLN